MGAAIEMVLTQWSVGPGLFAGAAGLLLLMAASHALARRRPALSRVMLCLLVGATLGAAAEVLIGPVTGCFGDGTETHDGRCPGGLARGWFVLVETLLPATLIGLACALPGSARGDLHAGFDSDGGDGGGDGGD
ncbi:hypothetical protein [Roseospirillum parvum]|uniref:Uncharacterized protein n=1 Tax=Roseospirillum parvum TaxID=83401 RepID=A0A1G7ZZ39_9PROT|nr:hypothetical protein [Roseospirillum parvum]SDH13945.1 hypothetical protein SAMN05421742_104269 [Roseospirillum parvum]